MRGKLDRFLASGADQSSAARNVGATKASHAPRHLRRNRIAHVRSRRHDSRAIGVGKSPCVKQRGEEQNRRPSLPTGLQWDFTARLAAQRGAAGRNDWPERDGNCRIELPKANGPQEPDRSRAPSSLLWVPTQPARLKLARRGQSWELGPESVWKDLLPRREILQRRLVRPAPKSCVVNDTVAPALLWP